MGCKELEGDEEDSRKIHPLY